MPLMCLVWPAAAGLVALLVTTAGCSRNAEKPRADRPPVSTPAGCYAADFPAAAGPRGDGPVSDVGVETDAGGIERGARRRADHDVEIAGGRVPALPAALRANRFADQHGLLEQSTTSRSGTCCGLGGRMLASDSCVSWPGGFAQKARQAGAGTRPPRPFRHRRRRLGALSIPPASVRLRSETGPCASRRLRRGSLRRSGLRRRNRRPAARGFSAFLDSPRWSRASDEAGRSGPTKHMSGMDSSLIEKRSPHPSMTKRTKFAALGSDA